MGKILIIPGADFSVNAIGSADIQLDITSLFGPVLINKNALSPVDDVDYHEDYRVSIIGNSMLDLSTYIAEGYSKLSIEIQSGYAILGIFLDNKYDTARSDEGRVYFPEAESGWYTEGDPVDLIAKRPWVAINIKKTDDSAFTNNDSTDLADYIILKIS